MAKNAQIKKAGRMHKIVDGKVVLPILYNGKYKNHPTFIAGAIQTGEDVSPLVLDNNGVPVKYKDIQADKNIGV